MSLPPTTKVLIVDDEEDFSHLMKLSLEATGEFQVHYVSQPAEAVHTAREFMPDVVILDLNMPGMDGGELVILFRSDPDLGRIPIIFLTASYVSGDDNRHPTLFGYPCVEKPCAIGEVVCLIEESLDGHNGRPHPRRD